MSRKLSATTAEDHIRQCLSSAQLLSRTERQTHNDVSLQVEKPPGHVVDRAPAVIFLVQHQHRHRDASIPEKGGVVVIPLEAEVVPAHVGDPTTAPGSMVGSKVKFGKVTRVFTSTFSWLRL